MLKLVGCSKDERIIDIKNKQTDSLKALN